MLLIATAETQGSRIIKRLPSLFMRNLCLFFLLTLFCLGCSTVRGPLSNKLYFSTDNPGYKQELLESKRKEYVLEHPKLSAMIKDSILNGEIKSGMTCEQVRASWGAPDHIYRSVTGHIVNEQWVYETFGDKQSAQFMHTKFLYFDNGILKSSQ